MLTDQEAPLYEIKADLFKGLAHPLRIRVLEILADAPDHEVPVSELLRETGLEASHLSQHLATLRRHRAVTSTRIGSGVVYSLAHPSVADLLRVARVFLVDTLEEAAARRDAARQSTVDSAARQGTDDGGTR